MHFRRPAFLRYCYLHDYQGIAQFSMSTGEIEIPCRALKSPLKLG